jgi:hypothetical protein
MSEALNVNVLVSAKEEYTNQLCYVLSPLIYQGVMSLFEESKKIPKQVRGVSYRNLQIVLANVQNWSSFIIEKETKRIKDSCSYLSDLVTAIFVSHVKILACVRLKGEHKNIKIKIPNMETFIHKIYILVCNKFYNNVMLIHEPEEGLINMISDIINECIRKQLPIEHILQEYLFDVFNDDSVESEPSEKSDKSNKEFTMDEVAEDDDVKSEAESEFENEQKAIPVVPIDGAPYPRDSPIPNFEDTTKIQIPESAVNTPNIGPTQLEDTDGNLEPAPLDLEARPISPPVTLFDDAKEL